MQLNDTVSAVADTLTDTATVVSDSLSSGLQVSGHGPLILVVVAVVALVIFVIWRKTRNSE